MNKAFTEFEQARSEQSKTEKLLKDAEVKFRALGGTLPEDIDDTTKITQVTETSVVNNPWINGSFYLIVIIILMTLIAVIGMSVSIYIFVLVIIGSLLALMVIGALQLRNDQNLNEENFLLLMIEAIKRIPILGHITVSKLKPITSDTQKEETNTE